jgi:hypothetical protein
MESMQPHLLGFQPEQGGTLTVRGRSLIAAAPTASHPAGSAARTSRGDIEHRFDSRHVTRVSFTFGVAATAASVAAEAALPTSPQPGSDLERHVSALPSSRESVGGPAWTSGGPRPGNQGVI